MLFIPLRLHFDSIACSLFWLVPSDLSRLSGLLGLKVAYGRRRAAAVLKDYAPRWMADCPNDFRFFVRRGMKGNVGPGPGYTLVALISRNL